MLTDNRRGIRIRDDQDFVVADTTSTPAEPHAREDRPQERTRPSPLRGRKRCSVPGCTRLRAKSRSRCKSCHALQRSIQDRFRRRREEAIDASLRREEAIDASLERMARERIERIRNRGAAGYRSSYGDGVGPLSFASTDTGPQTRRRRWLPHEDEE